MVTVMIACWNGLQLLKKNLPRVLDSASNKKNQIEEILVVDDNSSDGSVEYLSKNFPSVKIVRHEKNLGYAASCNTGMRNAKGELVAILNLDVIPAKDFLISVIPKFSDEKLFSVSFNEGKYGPGKIRWDSGMLEIVENNVNTKSEPTDWPSGGSSIFKKTIWESLTGMDELFLPFYWEDVDLGLRARKAGYKCLWEVKSRVDHQHESSINQENFKKGYLEMVKERNQLLLTWKNIDSFSRFLSHIFYILKRFFFHPGYFKVVGAAIFREISFKLWQKI